MKAIEERGMREVVDRNLAIKALKNEEETLEPRRLGLWGRLVAFTQPVLN